MFANVCKVRQRSTVQKCGCKERKRMIVKEQNSEIDYEAKTLRKKKKDGGKGD